MGFLAVVRRIQFDPPATALAGQREKFFNKAPADTLPAVRAIHDQFVNVRGGAARPEHVLDGQGTKADDGIFIFRTEVNLIFGSQSPRISRPRKRDINHLTGP